MANIVSKSSSANNSSANALKQLEAQGRVFTNKAFVLEIIGGDIEKVALFIDAGIDVNEGFDGSLPLTDLASLGRGSCEIAQLLIDNGANVNGMSENEFSPLRMAIVNDHKDLVQLLICNGADVNAADQDGMAAIHTAANHNRTELAQLLIENGANVNAETKSGITAMQIALSDNRKELVQSLIEKGADASPKSAAEAVVSEKLEITNIVERLELLEEKFGIAISALYASCYYQSYGSPPYHEVTINFDVTSLSGRGLERSFNISASAYNAAGQLLGTSSTYINNEEFMGFCPGSILCHLDQVPAKIRLFPSA